MQNPVTIKESKTLNSTLNKMGYTLAIGNGIGVIELLDECSGACIKRLYGHSQYIAKMHCVANGKYLVASSFGHNVGIWDFETGQLAMEFPYTIAEGFFYDEDYLYILSNLNSETEICVMDIRTLRKIKFINIHNPQQYTFNNEFFHAHNGNLYFTSLKTRSNYDNPMETETITQVNKLCLLNNKIDHGIVTIRKSCILSSIQESDQNHFVIQSCQEKSLAIYDGNGNKKLQYGFNEVFETIGLFGYKYLLLVSGYQIYVYDMLENVFVFHLQNVSVQSWKYEKKKKLLFLVGGIGIDPSKPTMTQEDVINNLISKSLFHAPSHLNETFPMERLSNNKSKYQIKPGSINKALFENYPKSESSGFVLVLDADQGFVIKKYIQKKIDVTSCAINEFY